MRSYLQNPCYIDISIFPIDSGNLITKSPLTGCIHSYIIVEMYEGRGELLLTLEFQNDHQPEGKTLQFWNLTFRFEMW